MKDYKFNGDLIPIDFEKSYNDSDSEILKKGIRAMNMDEKWDIIFDQNTLSFYRSWTGRGIFKIEFLHKDNQLIVEKAFVEEDFSNQQGVDSCSTILNKIIEVIVLNKDPEFLKTKNES
ncbi:hypothetical protein [Aquimarina sp. 2201CG14-23]|uniref:hypothetical protein n=1 Tax=Aquimarina mycalae TaxID=3040073 RepID=UPI002477E4BC|nr:hypothetical protein [Aquimarina sp. 2201CG14-23]MDH7444948.1 hypothetical protein [Aquimarina sp. 2201CG14-23]